MILIVMLATIVLVSLLGFTEIVAPIAKVALLLVPAIFAVSLAIGFAFRRQNWF